MGKGIVNKHGRKWGRGWRPWLLVPKVVGVGVYVGGLVSVLVVLWAGRGGDAAEVKAAAETGLLLMKAVVLPGLATAVVCGLGLLAMHGGVMAKMRWLQAKVALAMLTLPIGLFMLWVMLEEVRDWKLDLHDGIVQVNGAMGLTASVLCFSVLVMWLGRHKPRLAQWERAVEAQKEQAERNRIIYPKGYHFKIFVGVGLFLAVAFFLRALLNDRLQEHEESVRHVIEWSFWWVALPALCAAIVMAVGWRIRWIRESSWGRLIGALSGVCHLIYIAWAIISVLVMIVVFRELS